MLFPNWVQTLQNVFIISLIFCSQYNNKAGRIKCLFMWATAEVDFLGHGHADLYYSGG